jgi:hypothetical protein
MNEVTCVWQIPALLGEGPLWVAQENALYWVDILQRQVHRLEPASGHQRSWTFAEPITSLVQRQAGGFVGTTPDGFVTVDFESQTVAPIVLPEAHLPHNRFNDGKVDGYGRYWSGTMHKHEQEASGTLYRLDPDLSLHTMDTDYIITNGPAFSVDGTTMYHNDSVKGFVYAFDLQNDGTVGGKRPFPKAHLCHQRRSRRHDRGQRKLPLVGPLRRGTPDALCPFWGNFASGAAARAQRHQLHLWRAAARHAVHHHRRTKYVPRPAGKVPVVRQPVCLPARRQGLTRRPICRIKHGVKTMIATAQPAPNFYCSDWSLAIDEPMAGTAVSGKVWLCLEVNQPWTAKATSDNSDNSLPAPVQNWLAEQGGVVNGRLQFIKQPRGERTDWAFFVACLCRHRFSRLPLRPGQL